MPLTVFPVLLYFPQLSQRSFGPMVLKNYTQPAFFKPCRLLIKSLKYSSRATHDVMNEEKLTPKEDVGFPTDTWMPKSLGVKEPPPRGRICSLLVSLSHYTFSAQGAHLLLLIEDKNTAFCPHLGCLLWLDFTAQSLLCVFIQKKVYYCHLWESVGQTSILQLKLRAS